MMEFTFNYGGQYFEASSDDFCTSLIVTLIGTFVGFFLALYADRKLANKNAKQQKTSQILYLKSILKSLENIIPMQLVKFNEFADTIRKSPLEIHQPEILVTFDVLRLRNLDSVETQEAYFHFFSNSEDPYKDYKNLFAHGDFLFRRLELFEQQVTKDTTDKQSEQILIRDLMEETSLLLANRGELLMQYPTRNLPMQEELDFITNLNESYGIIISKMIVFQEVKDLFIAPLMAKSLSIIKDVDLSQKIFGLTRKANNLIKTIEGNSLLFADEIKNIEKELGPSLNNIKTLLAKLDKIEKNEA